MRRGHPKWTGRCEACGAWNSLIEEVRARWCRRASAGGGAGARLDFVALARRPEPGRRGACPGIAEFDRVCGGGLVAGVGDPGRRRSRHRQIDAAAAGCRRSWRRAGSAPPTIHRRGGDRAGAPARRRLGVADSAGAPRRGKQCARHPRLARRDDPPRFVVIDSIQTMYLGPLDSAPGTVSQVRGAAQELIALAKRRGFVLILVGHVTKEGLIAGPRVLEHMVDTVLYFEGERGHQFRILRAVKNRFGADRRDRRLRDERPRPRRGAEPVGAVPRRSHATTARSAAGVAGSAVFAGIEGTRPVLVEIQALVAPSRARHAAPRRGRLGRRPPGDDPRSARRALRPVGRGQRRLPQYRRRPADRRTGRRSSPSPPRWSALDRDAGPDRCGRVWRDGPVSEVRPPGGACRIARLKEAAKLGFARGLGFRPARSVQRPEPLAADGIGHGRPIGHRSELGDRPARPGGSPIDGAPGGRGRVAVG